MKVAILAAVLLFACTAHAGVDIEDTTTTLRGTPRHLVGATSRPDISGVYLDYSGSHNWISVKNDGKGVIGIGSDDQRNFFVANGELIDAAAKRFKISYPEGTFEFVANDNAIIGQGDTSGLDWTYEGSFNQYGGPFPGMSGPYVDPNHHKDGDNSFAGRRIINLGGRSIDMVGSDDGVQFWHVTGQLVEGSDTDFTIDFSPKGGPKDLKGSYDNTKQVITWADGNQWSHN